MGASRLQLLQGPRRLRRVRKMTCIFPESCDIIIQLQKVVFKTMCCVMGLMQKKVQIISDGSKDLSPELSKEKDIEVVPFMFRLTGSTIIKK